MQNLDHTQCHGAHRVGGDRSVRSKQAKWGWSAQRPDNVMHVRRPPPRGRLALCRPVPARDGLRDPGSYIASMPRILRAHRVPILVTSFRPHPTPLPPPRHPRCCCVAHENDQQPVAPDTIDPQSGPFLPQTIIDQTTATEGRNHSPCASAICLATGQAPRPPQGVRLRLGHAASAAALGWCAPSSPFAAA